MTRARRPLAEAAADPTFQPRRSDVAALVELLGGADEAIAEAAEAALLRVGAPAIPTLEGRLAGAVAPLRGRLVRALGRFARDEPRLVATIAARIADDDPKARRNAIIAAGKLDDPALARALLERAAVEPSLPHLRSLAAAIGKVGGEAGLAWLDALDDRGDPELARIRGQALLIAGRSRTRGEASSAIVGERSSPRPLTFHLTVRRGLEGPLIDEIAARGLGRARIVEPGVVAVHGRHALADLRRCRLGLDLAIVVDRPSDVDRVALPRARELDRGTAAPGSRGPSDDRVAELRSAELARGAPPGSRDRVANEAASRSPGLDREAAPPGSRARVTNEAAPRSPGLDRRIHMVLETCSLGHVPELLSHWTEGPIRYRLALVGGGRRRAEVWALAQALADAFPTLVNDPTESTWELRVEGDGRRLLLIPRRLDDPRFAYRRGDVPAASHPTIAAALAAFAGVRGDDVIWDPFVGSALELCERGLLGPYRALHGSDVDPRALTVAADNLAAAGLAGWTLAEADALTHAIPGGVTCVLTNPPLGRRVHRGDAQSLLGAFLGRIGEVLRPGGRLCWITPQPAATGPEAAAAGLHRERWLDVDLGGFRGTLERWRRPG